MKTPERIRSKPRIKGSDIASPIRETEKISVKTEYVPLKARANEGPIILVDKMKRPSPATFPKMQEQNLKINNSCSCLEVCYP